MLQILITIGACFVGVGVGFGIVALIKKGISMFRNDNNDNKEFKSQSINIETLNGGYWVRSSDTTYTNTGIRQDIRDLTVFISKKQLIEALTNLIDEPLTPDDNKNEEKKIGFSKD